MTRVGAGLSTLPGTAAAVSEASRAALPALGGAPVDLAMVFVTPDHLTSLEEAAEVARRELAPRHLIGCVAQGVIGNTRELERGPGATVWAASLPGAELRPFHLEPDEADDADALAPLDGADLVCLLVDPYSFRVDELLERANERLPGVPFVGGLAVGGGHGGQALLVDGEIHEGGAAGVEVRGVDVEVAVSQGCAPLGPESVITRAEQNVVFELAGQPALTRLRETIEALSARERALASRGLLAGLVIDENRPEYRRGDFLMRAILGADETTGALAIGETVRVGQTLRFHARDAASADEDLRQVLDQALARAPAPPRGALLFTCNGRGAAMFSESDHDSRAVADAIGPAVAGLFCGGEIGPVGGSNFVHGFTATMALFLGDD
jgi:small ligand-binding sensory domain FIST